MSACGDVYAHLLKDVDASAVLVLSRVPTGKRCVSAVRVNLYPFRLFHRSSYYYDYGASPLLVYSLIESLPCQEGSGTAGERIPTAPVVLADFVPLAAAVQGGQRVNRDCPIVALGCVIDHNQTLLARVVGSIAAAERGLHAEACRHLAGGAVSSLGENHAEHLALGGSNQSRCLAVSDDVCHLSLLYSLAGASATLFRSAYRHLIASVSSCQGVSLGVVSPCGTGCASGTDCAIGLGARRCVHNLTG